ncbi:hypothetical protein HYV10_02250 [Candidatus Dependentiae bacterium]|nr:hypothetical protein [Candidatus Dependentiae bacterium]
MNYKLKKFISAAILFSSFAAISDDNCSSCSTCPSTCAQGQNTWQPHAFSASMGREALINKHAWVPTDNEESWHGTVAVSGEFQKSFTKCCGETVSCCDFVGSLPFWSKNENGQPTYSNAMRFGDGTTETVDLDAYQVGMGQVANSGNMVLSPSIYQAGADFFLYIGAHKVERGFFFKAHGPVGVINVNPCFTFSDDVVAGVYPAGALNSSATEEIAAPNANLGDAFSNPKAANFLKPMNFGLICGNRTSSAKFGDPEFTLGYNVYADERKHLGLGIRFAAPTGNKAQAIYMLEPIFGRDGHWAAGAEIISHWRFWESDTCTDRYMSFMFDGSILHLFNSKTMRSFDLKNNGAGSKYLLVAKFDSTSDNATFQNEITNAINITTLNITSSFAVEGNFAALIDFHWDNWSLALGYEGWGRSCEQLGVDCSCPGSVDFNEYAVVGRQEQVIISGYNEISLCEPSATIGKVQPLQHTVDANKGIVDASKSKNRIPSAIDEALDMEGQVARAVYTNKPFVQMQYTWLDSDYKPYLALYGGAEIPVGSHSKNSAVKFWNIGAQGGIAF